MVVHIMDQPELGKGEGPIALILAPTRELAEQIHREAREMRLHDYGDHNPLRISTGPLFSLQLSLPIKRPGP